MAGVNPRNVTPIIAKIRDFLGQRAVKNHLRFETRLSPRTQPPPALPMGCSHNLADNYYVGRDGRHESMPAQVAYPKPQKAIEPGESQGDAVPSQAVKKRALIPGVETHNWDM